MATFTSKTRIQCPVIKSDLSLIVHVRSCPAMKPDLSLIEHVSSCPSMKPFTQNYMEWCSVYSKAINDSIEPVRSSCLAMDLDLSLIEHVGSCPAMKPDQEICMVTSNLAELGM